MSGWSVGGFLNSPTVTMLHDMPNVNIETKENPEFRHVERRMLMCWMNWQIHADLLPFGSSLTQPGIIIRV